MGFRIAFVWFLGLTALLFCSWLLTSITFLAGWWVPSRLEVWVFLTIQSAGFVVGSVLTLIASRFVE